MVRPTMQDNTFTMRTQSSLGRALSLLDCFTPEQSEFTVRELAARSGIPRSTTHRLVAELLEWGALERGPQGVRIGMRLFELGAMAPAHATLREAASPSLHALAEVTGLTANLAIREGDHILYVDKVAAPDLTVPHSRLGGRGALHATALGKAILAHASRWEIEAALRGPLRVITPHTVRDPDVLRDQLATIRRTGVAYDLEESRPGLFCVAAAVRGRDGRALAAVSVTGATALDEAQRFASTVLATARTVERVMRD